jgi:hypothetical protein
MEEKIVLQGSQIIAEYMGAKKDCYDKWFYQTWINGLNFLGWNVNEFKYHKSWDWLMPVLLKMRNEKYSFRIQNMVGSDFVCIMIRNERDELIDISRSDTFEIDSQEPDSLLEMLFLCVIKAINYEKTDRV